MREITQKQIYWGECINVTDDNRASRVKVKVLSVFDDLEDEFIPWADCLFSSSEKHNLPYIGETVFVVFEDDDIMLPKWFRKPNNINLDENDYESGAILIDKDLSQYTEEDGRVVVSYTKSEGLKTTLTKNDNESFIIIRPDNTIILKNGNSNHVLHIAEDNISIGSEDRSKEPCVLGDQNETTLEMLNDNIKEIVDKINSGLDQIKQIALGSPYTAHLASPIQLLKGQLEITETSQYNSLKTQIPKTKSEISTLD